MANKKRVLYRTPAGPPPVKVGIPGYVRKYRERRAAAHKVATDYVEGRDKKIQADALILSKRSGMTYEEAVESITRAWAEQERDDNNGRKVRSLALGYDEGAIVDTANARLNAGHDPFVGLFGGKK